MSVDFHPYGEFFASGSLDTTLRVWDIRNKGCVHKYSGHPSGISRCRFSPDGRWVASAGDDGTVKLWDLTAGKLLKEFTKHDAAVPVLEFHPNEFLLATASMDRAVRFWDLETFELVGRGRSETSGIRAGAFLSDGRAFLTASSEHLRSWHWEPAESLDAVDVHWNKVADVSTHNKKLLGASLSSSFLGLWVVDLSSMQPFVHPSAERDAQQPVEPHDSVERESRIHRHREQRNDSAQKPSNAQVYAHDDQNDTCNNAAPQVESSSSADDSVVRSPAMKGSNFRGHEAPSNQRERKRNSPSHEREMNRASRAQAVHEEGPTQGKVNAGTEMSDTLLRGSLTPQAVQQAVQAVQDQDAQPNERKDNGASPSPPRDDAQERLRRHCLQPKQRQANAAEDSSAAYSIEQVIQDHRSTLQLLSSRLSTMEMIERFWEQADYKGAADALESANDSALATDLFTAIEDGTSDGYTLEACMHLLPCVRATLHSDAERHRAAAASAASSMAQSFVPLVRSTLSAPVDGTDLAREERMERCRATYDGFFALRTPLMQVASENTHASRAARAALDAIEPLSQCER